MSLISRRSAIAILCAAGAAALLVAGCGGSNDTARAVGSPGVAAALVAAPTPTLATARAAGQTLQAASSTP